MFCEKPLATDLPETIVAINTCANAGVKLMTALQRRFDPNFARVKKVCMLANSAHLFGRRLQVVK